MGINILKTLSKSLGTYIFLLLLLLKEVFPNAAYAFSTANGCFKDPACLAQLKGSTSSAISAPTGVGFGYSSLSSATSSGVVKTFVNGVADFAIVVGLSAAYVAWHYWSQTTNEQAQNRARERYCAATPESGYCGGIYAVHIFYPEYNATDTYSYVTGPPPFYFKPYAWYGIGTFNALDLFAILAGKQNSQYSWTPCVGWWPNCAPNSSAITEWKNWSQQERSKAVGLLTNSDWQGFTNSMPVAGTMRPGDIINAPKILIPGQEVDNPNLLGDDRQLRTVPGSYTLPIFPNIYPDINPDTDHDGDPNSSDTDDDNDGRPDVSDPQPRNPAVPTATVAPPSSPPTPSPTPPPEGGAQGDGAFAAEQPLPYAPPGMVSGQSKPDSCVAAACKMVIYDSTSSDVPEAWLRDATGVVPGEGTNIQNAVNGLAAFGVASQYRDNLSLDELKAATQDGPAIVTVKTSTTGDPHALIVDGFENNYALIRDPLPELKGAAYKVDTSTFMNAWSATQISRRAVIIQP